MENNNEIISLLEKLTKQLLHMQDLLQVVSKEIHALKPSSSINFPVRGTSDLKELYTALAKAQSEMPIAELNRKNDWYGKHYADLQSVVQTSRPALTKYGLAVYQEILTTEDGQTVLHTVLTHGSGQYIESRMRIVPAKNDIQTMSSYITYLKRISYASLVGVVTGDEDDDGEIATAPYRESAEKGTVLNRNYNPKEISPVPISKDQLDEIEYELQQYPDIAEMILDGMKIQSLCDLPKSKYFITIKRIREIKQLRNEGSPLK